MKRSDVEPVEWNGTARGGALRLLDQRALPERIVYRACRTVEQVATAIRTMVVRGAPAIGIAAAYGVVLAARTAKGAGASRRFRSACDRLAAARPTAVNLAWAVETMLRGGQEGAEPKRLLELARRLHDEQRDADRRLSRLGAERLPEGAGVLTHCNAGGLATAGMGSALGVIRWAHESGKRLQVYVDETRPLLQGARLTAWELERMGARYTVICDGAAASLMAAGKIQCCVTGADRIAANGDVVNKIGTYGVAVSAAHHGLPFYVAAPASTFDLSVEAGADIPIEERSPDEVRQVRGARVCARTTPVLNPAFDVTPARLVTAIFTERGEIRPLSPATIRVMWGQASLPSRPRSTNGRRSAARNGDWELMG